MEELSYLKNQLINSVKELKMARADYLQYLKDNPYRAKKHELEKQVRKQRKELFKKIPEKW